MPYQDIESLPLGIRLSLPKHAQEIFLLSYNNMWQQYEKQDHVLRGEIAMRAAWSAVKKQYERCGSGDWYKK